MKYSTGDAAPRRMSLCRRCKTIQKAGGQCTICSCPVDTGEAVIDPMITTRCPDCGSTIVAGEICEVCQDKREREDEDGC